MNATLLLVSLLMADAPTEHPYAKAKIGDSVTYKMSMPSMGAAAKNMTLRKTVTAKNDDTVTVKLETIMGDMAMPPQEMKINLKEKYDATQVANSPKDAKSDVKKLGDGKEKLSVGGKSYECTWISYQVSTDQGGTKQSNKVKTWSSKDVPLDGMVKMETDAAGHKMTTELVAVSHGK